MKDSRMGSTDESQGRRPELHVDEELLHDVTPEEASVNLSQVAMCLSESISEY
jgi:hypothetical protein